MALVHFKQADFDAAVDAAPAEPVLRWAALLHDVGKPPCFSLGPDGVGHFYGHAQAGAELAEQILRRLKAPTALRHQAVLLIEQHMTRLMPEKRLLKRYLGRWGRETVEQLLYLQQADMGSKGVPGEEEQEQFEVLWALLKEVEQESTCLTRKDLALTGHDLTPLGYQGREVGEKLEELLEAVLDERVKNEKEALLEYLKRTETS